MPLMQHTFIIKKQRMMMTSFEELPPHLQQKKQTQNNDLSSFKNTIRSPQAYL